MPCLEKVGNGVEDFYCVCIKTVKRSKCSNRIVTEILIEQAGLWDDKLFGY